MTLAPAEAERNIKSVMVQPNNGSRQKLFQMPGWISACLSGVLLLLAFPKTSFGFLAWFALIPLLKALDQAKSRWNAFVIGLSAGLVFFGLGLHWLIYVSSFGWVFMSILEAFMLTAFCLIVYELKVIQNQWLRAVAISTAWTAVEFLRTEIPVFGLGWNLLGYSQSAYPVILQSASVVGAYGLGFLIAFVNASLAAFFQFFRQPFSRIQLLGLLLSVFVVSGAMGWYGNRQLAEDDSRDGALRISVIQGNIPQDVKWELVAREKIIEIYLKLTELASFDQPAFIVWPEAAFPGYFNKDQDAAGVSVLAQKIQIPVLLGSPHSETWQDAYNSAYLLGADGMIQDRYDKIYLVPFGEYVPLKMIFGWFEKIAYSLGVSDFRAGRDFKVFTLPKEGVKFSVNICFEDIFPNLVRQFVKRGANMLVMITNDAWFGPSPAPYQHLQASIFRAVENGVPVVRAANTGISAFISRKGTMLDRVKDKDGRDIFVTGKQTVALPLAARQTLYSRGGFYFPYAAAALCVLFLFCVKIFSRKLTANAQV